MRQHAKSRGGAAGTSARGEFHSFHVRRGDFQFKRTRIEASEIYKNIQGILPENSTVFIATDERDSSFFDPLREHFDVKLLSDFEDLLVGVNTNYSGMIDQLVASRGEIFFGCWHSTFTGFIMRVRGYHSVKDKLTGYENGLLPLSYYYAPSANRDVMHKYAPVKKAFFNREFPTSWRDIDHGINHPGIEDYV
jgi:GDP-fucose protein O-fucosyltransferase